MYIYIGNKYGKMIHPPPKRSPGPADPGPGTRARGPGPADPGPGTQARVAGWQCAMSINGRNGRLHSTSTQSDAEWGSKAIYQMRCTKFIKYLVKCDV